MREYAELPTVQQVQPGGRAQLTLPLGTTYDQVTFQLTNCSSTDLKNFKVIVGSKAIWAVQDGGVIRDLNAYYGRVEATGMLTCWFYRPEMITEVERTLTSLGTLDVPSVTIQFDIDSGVTNPAIKAFALRRRPSPLGAITKLREYPVTFATGGKQDIDNIPRGARISAIHMFKSDVTHVELVTNNGAGAYKVVDWPKALLEAAQKQYGRSPLTAKATHVDLNVLSKADQLMPTANLVDMRLKPTIESSGGLTNVVEYIDGFHGI